MGLFVFANFTRSFIERGDYMPKFRNIKLNKNNHKNIEKAAKICRIASLVILILLAIYWTTGFIILIT